MILATCGDDPAPPLPCFETLADAVDASVPGDTIVVNPGEYHEAITIAYDLILKGTEGAVLLDPASGTDVITVTGGVVELRDLMVMTTRVRAVSVYDASLALIGGTYQTSGSQVEGGIVRAEDATLLVDADFPGLLRMIGGTALFGGQVWARHVDLTIGLSASLDGGHAIRNGGCLWVDGGAEHPASFGGTATNCSAAGGGGAIRTGPETALDLRFASLVHNTALQGGALLAESSQIVGEDVEAIENVATASGGALNVDGGSLALKNSRFERNSAYFGGGGIRAKVSSVSLEGVEFVDNTAAKYGGAADLSGAVITVHGSRFCGNAAASLGGALAVQAAALVVENSVFGGNRSEGLDENDPTAGGTIAADTETPTGAGSALIQFNTFVGNTSGGASVVAAGTDVWFWSNLLAANQSPTGAFQAGGLALLGEGTFDGAYNVSDSPIPSRWGTTGDPGLRRWDPTECDRAGVANGSSVDVTWPAWDYAGRDAGDPNPLLADPDGSRADVGAHGGPGADASVWTAAQDSDGYGPVYDCAVDDASIHPGAAEVWYDGVDSNCDYRSDFDADADGYDLGADCDDDDPAISPDAVERPNNLIDEDCAEGPALDFDGDGWMFPEDCDDADSTVHPGQQDIDAITDGNCDHQIAPLVLHSCGSAAGTPLGLLTFLAALALRRPRGGGA